MNYEQTGSDDDKFIIEEGRSMYDLEERLLEFSVRTIRLTERLKLLKQVGIFQSNYCVARHHPSRTTAKH